MLVEETRVEVEDPVADDVEAEVAGLDHAGVDRPDGDLVRVVAAHRHRPVGELEVVVDERAQRLVAVEADAVEVVRLALVPAGGGREVDDRRRRSLARRGRLEPERAVGRDEQRADDRPAVAVACSPAKRQPSASAARRRPGSRAASWSVTRRPGRAPRRCRVLGQPERGGGEREQEQRGDAVERRARRERRRRARSRGAARPTDRLDQCVASPRKPSASKTASPPQPMAARPGSRRRRSASR